jgi:hypothetical protein
LLQAERSVAGNHIGGYANFVSGTDHWVKLGVDIEPSVKSDIEIFVKNVGIPEEFDYQADLKYIYYRDDRILGIMAYNLVPMKDELVPLAIHIIGDYAFRKTSKAFRFMLSTFNDLKIKYPMICAHVPHDWYYITIPMQKFGFISYASDSYGKYYYLELK